MNKNQIITELDKLINNLLDFKKNIGDSNAIQDDSPKEMLKYTDNTFEKLKKALESDKWPEAVNPHLICDPNNEEDKLERGRGVLELMVEEDLKDLKILDFGCGEGQCVYVSKEYNPSFSVGYDLKENAKWTEYANEKSLFTTNFDEVINNGPYDVIILFDVIDHLANDQPTVILNKLKSVLSEKGKIYMRCHPWTSRHGTHLYHDLNKAYVHLVFTENEIEQLVPNSKFQEKSIGVKFPIVTYEKYISDSGLNKVSRRDITEDVEDFFKIPLISERIKKITKTNKFPSFQMGVQFLDFVISK